MILKLSLATVLISFMFTVLALQSIDKDPYSPVGKYLCSSYMEDGSIVTMPLLVTAIADAYTFQWGEPPYPRFGPGKDAKVGVSVAIIDTVFGAVEVATYEVVSGGLIGEWSSGDGIVRREVCTPAGMAA